MKVSEKFCNNLFNLVWLSMYQTHLPPELLFPTEQLLIIYETSFLRNIHYENSILRNICCFRKFLQEAVKCVNKKKVVITIMIPFIYKGFEVFSFGQETEAQRG